MRYPIDDGKVERLKNLIDERWAITKRARQHVPRDSLGLMKTDDMLAADATVEAEQSAIREQVAAIGEGLSGADEMLAYHQEISERHGARYGDAIDHLWHGVHGWIE